MTGDEPKKQRNSRPKNGQRSKQKGYAYEVELSAYLNEKLGLDSSRTILSGMWTGGSGADLEGVPHLHVEAKRTEALNVKQHLRQAEKAVSKRGSANIPVVITRQNQMKTGESLVILRLDHFISLYGAFLQGKLDLKVGDPMPERQQFDMD